VSVNPPYLPGGNGTAYPDGLGGRKQQQCSGREEGAELSEPYDLVCLCHLRWDFVYQRPQHLISRFAREHRTFFIDGLAPTDGPAHVEMSKRDEHLWVATPYIPGGMPEADVCAMIRNFLDDMMITHDIRNYVLWYYTPMALDCTSQFLSGARAVIYDCMDELSLFNDGVPSLSLREAELFRAADLVFTGGQALYEAKRTFHPRVHAFPSSIDVPHFLAARQPLEDPPDQAVIPHPRVGYVGVIDERLNLQLLTHVADARPDWHLVMVGPVVKIDPASLPFRENIHYLGMKSYQELPTYLGGWDVAMMPFAHNDATRFISPTKTLEYLAAGKPVVSTSIRDVVRPYGEQGYVLIADTRDEFVRQVDAALVMDGAAHIRKVDALLATTSWDTTWELMNSLIDAVLAGPLPHDVPDGELMDDDDVASLVASGVAE